MDRINFAMIGSGWRAEQFVQLAGLLPERLALSGVVSRNPERAAYLSGRYGAACYPTLDDLLAKQNPEFILVCVSKSAVMEVCLDALRRGIPVLSETPSANDSGQLAEFCRAMPRGARYQSAEQFFLRPDNAARLAVTSSGRLGEIVQARVTINHGYHAISLMRRLLGVSFENAAITAIRLAVPGYAGFSRAGMPERETVEENEQLLAVFDFGGKSGIYDFEANQHRSFIRSSLIQAKGVKGELCNLSVKYMADYKSPFRSAITRVVMGEDDVPGGVGLKGYLLGEEWLYENPFPNTRLSDGEIATAASLVKMGEYVRGGEAFYPFSQAAQDLYLFEAAECACESGGTVRTETQVWANE